MSPCMDASSGSWNVVVRGKVVSLSCCVNRSCFGLDLATRDHSRDLLNHISQNITQNILLTFYLTDSPFVWHQHTSYPLYPMIIMSWSSATPWSDHLLFEVHIWNKRPASCEVSCCTCLSYIGASFEVIIKSGYDKTSHLSILFWLSLVFGDAFQVCTNGCNDSRDFSNFPYISRPLLKLP